MTTLTAPPGYSHHKKLFYRYDMPMWRLFLMANFLALIPFGLGLIVLWLPYQFYLALGTPFILFQIPTLPLWITALIGVFIFASSMFFHEWLHGFTLQLMGKKPIYYFRYYYLLAGLSPGEFLTRWQYLRMTLTPLISMTLGGFLLLLFLPTQIGNLLLIALLLNSAASLGDCFVAYRVSQCPKEAVFNDSDGIQVFLPENH